MLHLREMGGTLCTLGWAQISAPNLGSPCVITEVQTGSSPAASITDRGST